jgi:molybdopterin synthase sulfur carrier subunit
MPVVLIPTAYRAPTGGQAEVETTGSDVGSCLRDVDRQHTGFLELVLDAAGQVHAFVKLFVNGEEISRDALDTSVVPSDRIEVLAAIAGG